MKWKKVIAGTTALCLIAAVSAGSAFNSTADKLVNPMIKIHRDATSTYQSGYKPSQISTAYGISSLSVKGSGETIAIVDAYGDPNMASDLQKFDAQFNLPAANLTVAYPSGTPSTDAGWALETALDVEWAHSIAPSAKILLVCAKSASESNLLTAINYANSHGAQVVSMSWGGSEFSGESNYDSYFSHSGTVYLASAGDNGAESSWPAASPKVVAVGGTNLPLDSNGNRTGAETAWSGSGGGLSSYVAEPTWQSNIGISSGNERAIPDVAFDADPNTGVAVYDSISYDGTSGWWVVGGTSLSAPAWAGLVALGDNYSPITSGSQLLYTLAGGTSYSNPQTNFNDITSGSNGYDAGTGYDLVTGLGSPVADKLIPKM